MLINNFCSIYAQEVDTIRNSSLEAPIFYSSKDSTKINFKEGIIYLYGDAKVDYDDVSIKANYIEYKYNESLVVAKYTLDSVGNKIGKPVFTDGTDNFEMDEIRYNTDTKKGVIFNVVTEQAEGFLHSEKIKKHENEQIHVYKGKYTTCDNPNPHYEFRLSKAVVIPEDKIVSGPLYVRFRKIPTPLVLPFGYFPNKKEGTNGIIIPQFGSSELYGFSLMNGGYYRKFSDKLDMQFIGNIYSKGSWGLGVLTRYKVNYKYSGDLNLTYDLFKESYKEFPNYKETKNFFVTWNHIQEASKRPNTRFSASVNAGALDNFRNNQTLNTNNYLTNNFQSNIAYGKSWRGKPYNLSVNLRHNQNNQTHIVNASLPEISFNVNRFYPLAGLRKIKTGNKKFYENIGVTWTSVAKNDITIADSLIDINNLGALSNKLRNGIKHTLAINAPVKILKNFTFNAGANFTDRMYLQTLEKSWDSQINKEVRDTIQGFANNYDYNLNASLTTTFYGTYGFAKFLQGERKTKIRHVISPNISYTYRPDFGTNTSYFNSVTGQYVNYSPFEIGIFGQSPTGESGAVSFNLINSLEMKQKDLKNSDEEDEQFKKIKLIENLTLGSNYDIAKDSLNFSNISIAGRTSLFKIFTVNFGAQVDPYKYTDGVKINQLLFNDGGKIGSLMYANSAIGINLHNKPEAAKRDLASFWNALISYSYDYRRNITSILDTAITTNSIRFDGKIDITKKWKLGVTTNYDFALKDISFTQFSLYRDLHCWEAAAELVPFGPLKRYMIRINIKASIFEDAKFERRRNIQPRNSQP